MIKIPGQTRWNSWYLKILEAFETRPAIVQILDQFPELEQYRLTAVDWELLKAMHNFLQPFHEVALRTEGKKVTLDAMQESADFLIYHFKKAEVWYAPMTSLLAEINTAWHCFNQWCELIDEIPAYVTAVLLHPSKLRATLKKAWNSAAWQRTGVSRAQSLWMAYKERYKPPVAVDKQVRDCEQELSLWELYRREVNVVPSEDDFTAFIEAPPTKLAPGTSALHWWCSPAQRKSYPALSKLAIDVLSPFAMSAASETVFSGACCTISWE